MYATLDLWLSSFRSLPGEMDETDALRSKRCNDDAISLAPSTTESIIVEGELSHWGGDWTLNSAVLLLVEIVMAVTLFYKSVESWFVLRELS